MVIGTGHQLSDVRASSFFGMKNLVKTHECNVESTSSWNSKFKGPYILEQDRIVIKKIHKNPED